jgi:ArsR family transcriptional regulator, arsenate/arsenite/antimonite-responsive transcriptional repressor / arsenate reductase (thioredoxin)
MSVEEKSVRRRAEVYAALGDPARLAVVDALALGDRSPGELSEALGMPSNLLAHHLRLLEQVGVIERGRSEADRRRSYVRLIHSALPVSPVVGLAAERVVFVCTHNSARSQLAAALWRDRKLGPVASAGTQPAPRVHPRAVKIAHRHGLTLGSTGTAHVSDVVRDGDLVIAVCDNAHEEMTGAARPRLHWSVPDPARAGTDEAFEAAYADIAGRIDRLAPTLTD